MMDTITHSDLFDLCAAQEDASIDMILADLPYGTTECSWDTVIPFEPMWAAFKRIIKPRGAIVLTASEPFASHLRMSWIEGYKYDWVWVKSRATDVFRAKLKPLNRTEYILIFSAGTVANCSPRMMQYNPIGITPTKKKILHNPRSALSIVTPRPSHGTYTKLWENYPDNILNYPSGANALHPTQKPVALFEYLIKTYTQPGDVVFDPVVGSGTTALVAIKTGRHYITGDSSLEYVEIARKRIQDGDPYQATDVTDNVKQLSLFEGVI